MGRVEKQSNATLAQQEGWVGVKDERSFSGLLHGNAEKRRFLGGLQSPCRM